MAAWSKEQELDRGERLVSLSDEKSKEHEDDSRLNLDTSFPDATSNASSLGDTRSRRGYTLCVGTVLPKWKTIQN
eukprot:scaffold1378_cov137-Cylindrotheca_fusiformis.AAC.3